MRIAKRTIMVWLGAAAVAVNGYFGLGTWARVSAHAELERQMRANFETMLCEGETDGDICLAHPDEGRCISGDYIDYRTVWGWPQSAAEAQAEIREHYGRLGSPQKFANWLACQGFKPVSMRKPPPPSFAPAAATSTLQLYFVSHCVDGYCVWQQDPLRYPFRGFGYYELQPSLFFDDAGELRASALQSQRAFY